MSNSTTPPDVVVQPGTPLIISDTYRSFGTVTIKPGGQIFVQTSAPVNIVALIKAAS